MSGPTAIERATQARRLLSTEGARGVAARLLERSARRLQPAGASRLQVADDVLLRSGAIASERLPLPVPLPHAEGEPLKVAWVCAPPSAGAGGFTTISRLIAGLEAAGHECAIYLHDRHGWPLHRRRETIRTWWPAIAAEIHDLADGLADSHAVFATSWETAYPVLVSPAMGRRLYLVQDHEPSFYPAGSESLLAEGTYTLGFYGVTAGRWLARLLDERYGMQADWFDFGCESDRYLIDPRLQRTGVCLYCRPSTPRRAFELGLAALSIFAERHPEIDVHLFGEHAGSLPFPAKDHGTLDTHRLNDLYNRCVAGIVLSATNVSLVPYEMLAAGCIPVVNDAPHNRIVLDNEEVVYAPPTPYAIASALDKIVTREPSARRAASQAAADSVRHASWAHACLQVERIVRRAVRDATAAAATEHGATVAADDATADRATAGTRST